MKIKGKGFVIRNYREGDQESLFKNINEKYIYDNTCNVAYPYSIKIADKWVKENKNGKKQNFAIDIKGEIAGGVGFKIECHKAEIGYWLGKNYRKKGIATDSVKAFTDYGFSKLKLKRIYAYVMAHNKKSCKVLEKNGYKKEGFLRKHCSKDGRYIDAFIYAKTR